MSKPLKQIHLAAHFPGFAGLDHLPDGRAAWDVVTSWDAFTGENLRRGGSLPQDERYSRAKSVDDDHGRDERRVAS